MMSRFAFDWTPQRIARLKMYRAAGMSGAAIARAFGCTRPVIYKQMRLLGLNGQAPSAALRCDVLAEVPSDHGDAAPRQTDPRRAWVASAMDGAFDARLSEGLIIRACEYARCTRAEFFIPRKRRFAWLRRAVMYVLREARPDYSLARLGKVVGITDHSTVSHHLQNVQALLAQGDPDTVKMVAALRIPSFYEVWTSSSRPGRLRLASQRTITRHDVRKPACAVLVDLIPENEIVPGGRAKGGVTSSGAPLLTNDEIAERIVQRRAERARYEADMLAQERARYGVTRQTQARALSRQVA